ncbi:MAG: SCP2 sterol-binding domain-containing protein [Candidatus Competibacteraceae bacterium]|nr:SCP2 sterol-binding domain-containing protein [Candidatus Competibacteraceae bacterium]
MTPAVLMTGLQAAFNYYLRLDPEIPPRLAALEGKVIVVELEGFGQTVYLLPSAGEIRVVERYEGEPSVSIRGTLPALLRGWRRDRAIDAGLTIEGDADVGREFQAILTQMDIDWEEQLSRLIGDAAAHQVGSSWRSLRGWSRRAAATLSRDGTEYLQQELRALPPRHAVEHFLSAVDTLREDADRLTVRVERLRRGLATDST